MIFLKGIFILAIIFLFLVFVSIVGLVKSLFHFKAQFHKEAQKKTKSSTTHTTSATQKKKIIPHDEGEYVDFEEVKD